MNSDVLSDDGITATPMEENEPGDDVILLKEVSMTSSQSTDDSAIQIDDESQSSEKTDQSNAAESGPSTSSQTRHVVEPCPECGSQADLQKFRKGAYMPKNRTQLQWLYRNQCSKRECGHWFGGYRRFEGMVSIEVDKDGWPIASVSATETDSQQSESVSPEEPENDEQMEVEDENMVDASTEEVNPPKKAAAKKKKKPYERRRKIVLTSVKHRKAKKAASKQAANEVPDKEESYEKRESPRKRETKREPAKKLVAESSKPEPKKKQSSLPAVVIPVLPKKSCTMVESACQTDKELLIRTAIFDKSFNELLEEELLPNEATQCISMPYSIKRRMVTLLNTIKAQNIRIANLVENEKAYKATLPQVVAIVKEIRMTTTDELSRIREDTVARNEEFKLHHEETCSIIKSTKAKYDKARNELAIREADYQLKLRTCEADLAYNEKIREYESERAAYYLDVKERAHMKKTQAETIAQNAEEKLRDKLFIREHEKCSHCQISTNLRNKMSKEVIDKTIEMDKAVAARNESDKKAQKAERIAQILGLEVDKLNYKNKTWEAQIARMKDQILTLNESLKAKDRRFDHSHILKTPTTILTPTISPENIDNADGPSISSPGTMLKSNNVSGNSKKVEKPKEDPPPISSTFASWISKEDMNKPVPKLPTLSPFGIPQKKNEELRIPPSQKPCPWEKDTLFSGSNSIALMNAAARVSANDFIEPQKSYTSRSLVEATEKATKAFKRERKEEKKASQPSTPIYKSNPSSSHSDTPPFKKMRPPVPTTPNYHENNSSSKRNTPTPMSSVNNMKKIPKLSEKPPPPGLGAALGVNKTKEGNESSNYIPGLGMLDADDRKREVEKKNTPAKVASSIPAAQIAPAVETSKKPGVPTTVEPTASTSKTNKNTSKESIPASPNKQHNQKKKNKGGGGQKPSFLSPTKPRESPWAAQRPGPSSSGNPNPFGIQKAQPRPFNDYPPQNNQFSAWSDSTPCVPPQQYQRPQQQQRGFYDSSRDREGFSGSGSLPWHRDVQDQRDSPFGATPFGRPQQPVREDYWGRTVPNTQPERSREWKNDTFFNQPQPNQQYHNYPPNSGNRRTFWE